jgi:adenylyltransferase/sulfurtransferase
MPPDFNPTLSEEEKLRYSRHLELEGFGMKSQIRLKNSKVLIVGAGGLGCPVGMYLAGAGVGSISVVDYDRIEMANMHRQIAFKTVDIKRPKAESLVDTMHGINPTLTYNYYDVQLTANNAASLVKGKDLVIDGTDNFATRFLLADACYLSRVPLLHGAVHQHSAQIALFTYGNGPCFRCLYSKPPENGALAACSQAGVLGVVTGAVGTLMATEAIKFLADMDSQSLEKVLNYDAMSQSITRITLKRDSDCPTCGAAPKITAVASTPLACSAKQDDNRFSLAVDSARQLIAQGALVVDVREPHEYRQGYHLPNAISLPLSQFKQDFSKHIPKGKPVVLYCQQGQRSLVALSMLQNSGYDSCYSIAGGITAWQENTNLQPAKQ